MMIERGVVLGGDIQVVEFGVEIVQSGRVADGLRGMWYYGLGFTLVRKFFVYGGNVLVYVCFVWGVIIVFRGSGGD